MSTKRYKIHFSYFNNLPFSTYTQRMLILSNTADKQDYYHLLLAVLFLSKLFSIFPYNFYIFKLSNLKALKVGSVESDKFE